MRNPSCDKKRVKDEKLLFIFSLLHTALFATGCVDEIVIASTQDSAVQLDGRASETAWESAVSYPLRLLPQPNQERGIAFQEGSVRFLCGSQFLYVYAELTDDDIVQYGSETEDLCKRGDVLELFIRDRKKVVTGNCTFPRRERAASSFIRTPDDVFSRRLFSGKIRSGWRSDLTEL